LAAAPGPLAGFITAVDAPPETFIASHIRNQSFGVFHQSGYMYAGTSWCWLFVPNGTTPRGGP
jgi:hypothetical protein